MSGPMEKSGSPAAERAVAAFESLFGTAPSLLVRAPGRVNLIGEHTDYNDGFVLPMALPFDTAIAAEPWSRPVVEATSEGFGRATFAPDDDPRDTTGWALYLHGMTALLREEGHRTRAWRGVVATDIPAGAGLASSAALEVASGLSFVAAAGASIEPEALARLGQRVERELVGVPSGVMDQLASAASREGYASLIDCRDLSIRPVPLPAGTTIVVMDTGTRRELADSAFAERQATCAAVALELGVEALRDATVADLVRLGSDELAVGRARHVITENERTLAAADAMDAGDVGALGHLITASHRSLRDDYEVSGPALDAMVGVAEAAPGCLGARMTGGGFAGCAVAVVRTEDLDAFIEEVLADYVAPAEQPAAVPVRLHPVRPHTGAEVLRARR